MTSSISYCTLIIGWTGILLCTTLLAACGTSQKSGSFDATEASNAVRIRSSTVVPEKVAFSTPTLAMAPAPAVAAATIAVADFEGGSSSPNKNDFWSRALADFMIADLQASKNLRVVDREHLNDTLREQRLSSTDLSDPEARLRIGKILGARYFIFGTYTIVGDNAALTARMDSVETGQIVKTSSVAGKEQDLGTLSQELAVDFLRPIDQEVADAEAHRTPLGAGPPAQARNYFEQGLIDEQKGNYDRAVDSYAHALAVYPDYFDAREHLEKASEAGARQ